MNFRYASRIIHPRLSRVAYYARRLAERGDTGLARGESRRERDERRHALRFAPYLILALLPFLFFWRLFAPNPLDRALLPAGDLTLQYFPLRIFAAQEFAAGRLPLWNPHIYAGQPALADSQLAALYPINWLTALLLGALHRPFTFAVFQLQIVIHYALAAIFTYAFARRLTGSRFGAWVAALTFTFGGYLISYPAQQPTILESAVWLPLVLLLLDWAADDVSSVKCQVSSRRAYYLSLVARHALAGAAMAMSILAGHPQTFIYVFYTAIAYSFFRWQMADRRWHVGVWVLGFGIFCFFAIGLSAVQLLPTLEFTRLSTRAQLGYPFTSGGFAPHELITLIIPGYFGGLPLYVGIVPLLLAGVAILRSPTADGRLPLAVGGRWPYRPAQSCVASLQGAARFARHTGQTGAAVGFFLLLALVALFLSFGDSSFLYSLFYLFAPGFAQIRDQERVAFLWSFALAMLAAIGAASIRPQTADGRPRYAAVVFGWLLLGAVVLIVLAVLGALASESAPVNLFPGALRQLVPNFFWLLGAWALWRLYTRTHPPLHGGGGPFVPRQTGSGWRARWLAVGAVALLALNLFSVNGAYNFQKPTPPNYFPETALTRALQDELRDNALARVASEGLLPGGHNAGAEYGFADINGNDPLRLDMTEQFDKRVEELRRFQLLGVQYVVTTRIITHGAFAHIASDGDAHLYRFNGALPRAWLVHGVRVMPFEKTFDALNDAALDPATTAILQHDLSLALPPAAPTDDDVTITQHGAGHLALRARSTANGLVVVSEILYPGWQVTVDGQSAQLVPADGILMAMAVPSGDHNIELTFAPDLVKMSAAVSALSVLLFCAVLIAARR